MPTDIADHLATMDRAARDSSCGVPWHLLAAIARVESDFGRNMATSSAGAIGYGQFLPSSWQAFGTTATSTTTATRCPAIALYLCQSGLERDPRAALFAYNHADWYVDLVLDLAVRYDRMAPGAPTPDVLELSPAPAGRRADALRRRTGPCGCRPASRTVDGSSGGSACPWRGRAAGQSITPAGARHDHAHDASTECGWSWGRASDDRRGRLATTWARFPTRPGTTASRRCPGLARSGRPPSFASTWRWVSRSSCSWAAAACPGHPPGEDIGEQPLLLDRHDAGRLRLQRPDVFEQPRLRLQISEQDLLSAWDAAARPRQALAFVPRPRPPAARHTSPKRTRPRPSRACVATPYPGCPSPSSQPSRLPSRRLRRRQ